MHYGWLILVHRARDMFWSGRFKVLNTGTSIILLLLLSSLYITVDLRMEIMSISSNLFPLNLMVPTVDPQHPRHGVGTIDYGTCLT